MATSFCTAVSTFINLWLIGLLAFAVAASAVFLYILGAADATTGLPVALSLAGAVFSWTYLILQSINASHIKNRRFNYRSRKSRLGTACIHLPRVLIAIWVATTAVGLYVALRQPLCVNGDVKTQATAWQAGFGCWIFRVLVSLNAVMAVLSMSIFYVLEVNSRYMPHGLFHVEYTASTRRRRRRTLLESTYGATDHSHDAVNREFFGNFNSPVTINTEDGLGIMNPLSPTEQEKRMVRRNSTISPPPTYRTFDFDTSASLRTSNTRRQNPSLSALDEESVLDLTTLDGDINATSDSNYSSRPTTTTTIVPLNIFTHGQVHNCPISDIPSLPASLQAHLKELEDLRNGTVTGSGSGNVSADDTTTTKTVRPNVMLKLQHKRPVLGEITNSSIGQFKSSCALPLHHTSDTLSQLSKTHKCHHHRPSSSTTTPFNDLAAGIKASATKTQRHTSEVVVVDNHNRRSGINFFEVVQRPAPAWCKEVGVKQAPLSADPAIKRLTEKREMMRRESVMNRLSQFEFGFGFGGNTEQATGHRRATTRIGDFDVDVDVTVKEREKGKESDEADRDAEAVGKDSRQGREKENIPPSVNGNVMRRKRIATVGITTADAGTGKANIKRVGTGIEYHASFVSS